MSLLTKKCLYESEELLIILDIMDLDEHVVDEKVRKLMEKKCLSVTQLRAILVYLKYKYLICLQEETDCDNDDFFIFAVKLLMNFQNAESENKLLLEILTVSLLLNREKIQNYAEHVLQQLIACEEFQASLKSESDKSPVPLHIFNTILVMCVTHGVQLLPFFLNHEFGKLLEKQCDIVNVNFYSKTVPMMMEVCRDYTLLNVIWDKISSRLQCNTKYDFIIMCTLSEYYMPMTSLGNETMSVKVRSSMMKKVEFWKMIQYGLLHEDYIVRKCSVYLARRAILSCEEKTNNMSNINIKVTSIFSWNNEKASVLKDAWNSLFVLLETLEEKQSELVLSSLKLFDCIGDIHYSWFHIALVRALSHNANTVVLEATKIALTKNVIQEDFPHRKVLEALNNMYFYECFDKVDIQNPLRFILKNFLQNKDCLMNIMKNMSVVKLTSIPKYSIYSVIGNILIQDSANMELTSIIDLFLSEDSLTNNILFDYSIKCYVVDFIINHRLVKNINDLFNIVGALRMDNAIIQTGNILWDKLLLLFETCSEYIIVETSTFLVFWNDCITTKNNVKSMAGFVLLMIEANIIPKDVLNKILNDFISKLKVPNDLHGKVLLIMADMIAGICNLQENEYERAKIWDDEVHKLVLLRVKTLANEADENTIENILNCLQIFILNTVTPDMSRLIYEEYIIHAKNILNLETNIKYDKYLGLKIISCIARAIHNMTWSNKEKYSLINPMFNLVKDLNRTQIQVRGHGTTLSRLNKETIIIYIENYRYLDEWNFNVITDLYGSILHFLETGGYGCLPYVIKLSFILLKNASTDLSIDKIRILVDYTWKEIFAIRKSGDFKDCLSGFIKMVFQKKILEDSTLTNILVDYSNIIFEFSDQVPEAAHLIMLHIYHLQISHRFILCNILSKALVFGTPFRKDQRMEQDILNEILNRVDSSSRNRIYKEFLDSNSHVRMIALSVLMKQDIDLHVSLTNNLINKLDSSYKSNNRYHGNSLHHRMLLRTVQFLCISATLHKHCESKHLCVKWCVQRLISQPHHTSCKILLEWYISLYIINNDLPLNATNMRNLNLESVPQISYFTILYHVVKHRLTKCAPSEHKNVVNILDDNLESDLEFVINIFLQHTMGQLFNIRLHVQYYIMTLLHIVKGSNIYSKYSLFVDTIEKTFDCNKTDKSLLRIQQDFYINKVDVVHSLSLINIYNSILRLTNVSEDEWIALDILRSKEYVHLCGNSAILTQTNITSTEESYSLPTNNCLNENDKNIQKKFIPWQKILSEIGVAPEITDDVPRCELVVVASLIDRLPNLGGLSRTCEVFGVKRYVISSLAYLQHKEFQTISMSSEKWLDITEKIPGPSLKKYLLEMKNSGYDIIAAEQTSSSVSLKSFKFPKKSLLLVGHEKDGIPCDLICMMDHCVEIPQHGMVRSLNVHVTASIFIWEYIKQHSLEL